MLRALGRMLALCAVHVHCASTRVNAERECAVSQREKEAGIRASARGAY